MRIKSHITPVSIANSIMMDKTFTGNYVIVEGESDSLFFSKFTDKTNNRISIAFGYENVIEIIKISEKRKRKGVLGIIDSDFNNILNHRNPSINLLQTDTHDLETLIIKSETFEYVTNSLCSKRKLKEFEKSINLSLRDYLLELSKPLALFRLVNQLEELGLMFKPSFQDGKELKFEKIIDKRTFTFLGEKQMFDSVKNYYNQAPALIYENIKEKIDKLAKKRYNIWQLCNGHDIIKIFAIGLKQKIGSKNISAIEIEKQLINSYDSAFFKETDLFKKIIKWQNKNSRVLSITIFGDEIDINNSLENIRL